MLKCSAFKYLKVKVFAIFAIALVGAPSSLLPAQTLQPEDLYSLLQPSIVTLKVQNSNGERFTGSGFLAINDDLAVTAWHVIYDATNVTAYFADGQQCSVTGWVDKNEQYDLALIRLNSQGHPRVSFAKESPRVGSRIYVIGAPKGYGFSIAEGLLSQIQEIDGFTQYQVSCPFSTGNSGGPLVNSQGAVVGVASWSKRGAQNLNFAVPASRVAQLNPAGPVVPWHFTAANTSITRTRSAYAEGQSVLENEPSHSPNRQPDLLALQSLLKASVGQRVTIVVRQDQTEKEFTFLVPE